MKSPTQQIGTRQIAARVVAAVLCVAAAGERAALAQARSLAISAIQGPGARSPVEGQLVVTSGIVTARKTNGFFIQSTVNATDGDERTSEGLFVFTGTAPAATVTPGTMTTVTGRVIEFIPAADPSSPPLTEIGEAPIVEVGGAGASLPAPIELRAVDIIPSGGQEQLERYEGMRVRIASLFVVGPTLGSVNEPGATALSNGVFYGVIAGVPRPLREPGIDVLQPLPAGAPCCVPRFDGNPERIRVDSDGQPGAPALDLPAGSVVENLVGPLDYGFQSYTVLPDPPPSAPAVRVPVNVAPVRDPGEDEFSVASINLQRFFDTTDDRDVADVALTAAAFQTRLSKASLWIRQLLRTPDVVAVAEIENVQTLQALALAVNRDARDSGAPDPLYDAYLEEGNDPGGIDVGVLVRRARVEVLEYRQEGKAATFQNPTTAQQELLNDRPPFLLSVRITSRSNAQLTVTILVNHLRSLVDIESVASGARVRAKRAAQAEFVAGLLSRRFSDDRNERLLVVGDLNAFEFNDGYVDVVGTIRGAPAPRLQVVVETRDAFDPDLVNLVDLLPSHERYSYVLDGTAQALDHMLVTEALRPDVSLFTYVRGNADSPEVWRSDARRAERISDHDAALAYFRLTR
jgi:predicted extracellular nuclease